jgi:hypothetical protein
MKTPALQAMFKCCGQCTSSWRLLFAEAQLAGTPGIGTVSDALPASSVGARAPGAGVVGNVGGVARRSVRR